jgi:Tol biopolymer transport system component
VKGALEMKKWRYFIVILIVIVLLVLPSASLENGRIAFVSDRDGNMNIYVMSVDGTGQTRLTTNPASDNNDPVWSPDGSKIVFNSSRDGNNEIYSMNSDGTDQTCLTKSSASDSTPAMSPDGKKITFTSNRDGNDEIYVMNSDGTSQTRLTMNAASDLEPTWSPDGKRIAFASNRAGNYDIYVMNADGTGQTSLTNNLQYDSRPAWSPDGKKIAFETNRDGTWTYNIWIMNADGTGQTRLTTVDDVEPAWSPDGSKITFCSWRVNAIQEIFIMNPDGSGQTQITSSPPAWNNSGPVWEMHSLAKITLTSPNGGESWQRGTPHTVTWDYTGSPGSTVKITLLKAGIEVGTINASTSIGTSGMGSYTWPISSTGGTGSDYKVSVQSISEPTIKDASNNYFTISPADTIPKITVTSPNGGETWKRGTSKTITWNYAGSPGSTVKIVLLKGSTQVGTISAGTSIGTGGKGSYTWPIYPTGGTGSDYKVSVGSLSHPTIKDSSNNFFNLTF